MKVEYTGRQTTVTKKLKLQAEEGLAQIVKIVGTTCTAHVILSTDKYRQIAEITLKTKSGSLVATCEATEMTVALHDALAKIEQQAIRHKQKTTKLKRHPKGDLKEVRSVSDAEPEAKPVKVVAAAAKKAATKNSVGRKAIPMLVHSFPSKSPLIEPHVVRTLDHTALKPMSLEEAVKEAAFRDREVFVFRDYKGQAMVLHRKRDGKIELIEIP
jgi:putative sigma-54 modulation protein